jgi:hypothetical protein
VARTGDTVSDGSTAFSGEGWTDARGYPTVAEFFDRRFTIATDEPHEGGPESDRADGHARGGRMNAITDEPARGGLTPTRRWMLALAVAVSTAAVLAGTASADQPNVLERNHAYIREVPHAATCKPYGYTFAVSYHYDVRRTITEFADDDGNVLREVIEAHFVGLATNDSTGKLLPVDGERHIVWDFVAGTWTETGTLRHVTVPGSGVVLLQSGRIVYPLPAVPQPDVIPKVELFEAGPHDVFEGQYADFCAALAES